MKSLLPVTIMLCSLFAAVDRAFAQTWTQTSAPTTNWTSIVSSADGTKLVAACPGTCFISTNSGITWMATNLPPDIHFFNNVPNFAVLGMSADGTKLAGASDNNGIIGVSTNGGLNWSYPTNYAEAAWESIVSSADGKNLVLTEAGAVVRASTNSGATWYPLADLPNSGSDPQYAAMSANGNCLSVKCDGYVFATTNFGNSWQTNILSTPCKEMAASADGTKLVTAPYGSNIYTSTNSGANWIQQTNSPNLLWWSCASSADGTRLAAVSGTAGGSGVIYTSNDSGMTWVSNNVPGQQWSQIISSADGNELAAIVNGNHPVAAGGIWISHTTPSPQLNLSFSSGDLNLFWIVPSTHFVLQESPDLSAGSWTTMTNSPILDLTHLQDQTTLAPGNDSGFFRLVAQ
jgi:photosystem II stability/assembly factor-like uncharacterized protein